MEGSRKIILIAIILGSAGILLLLSTGLKGCNRPPPDALKSITLKYWTVWDEQDDFDQVILNYKTQHPNIDVEVTKFRYEEYFEKLIDAWARDQGPDIFSIPNTRIREYQDFISPMPEVIKMAYNKVTKRWGIFTEEKIDYIENRSLTPKNLKNNYLDVVPTDVVIDDQIWALPYSIDTLVLYYNRDLLNKANIPLPPSTWTEFVQNIPLLTLQDDQGNIVQAGAALGTSKNIPRATDILSILMIQNGTPMMTNNRVDFASTSPTVEGYIPGEKAVEFYTDFASPLKEVYTWNEDMTDALELFSQGNLALFFGYSYQLPTILQSGVNFDVATLPQVNPENESNFANYWAETVFARSENTNEAWDFIQFVAKPENVVHYLNSTNKPTVMKALIEAQKEDLEYEAFLNQILTAQSWYKGNNAQEMETSLKNMIDSVVSGEKEIKEAINLAEKQVQLTVKKE